MITPERIDRALARAEKELRLVHGDCVRLTRLAGFENIIYRVEVAGVPVSVLRVAERRGLERSHFEAELAFLAHLASRRVSVPQLLRTIDPHDDGLVITEFAFIRGRHLPPTHMTSGDAMCVGRAVRALHSASRAMPTSISTARPRWHDSGSLDVSSLAPFMQRRLADSYDALVHTIRQRERQELLVHGDLNHQNLIFTPDVFVIDFDDSCRASAEYDFAVLLTRYTAVDPAPRVVSRVCEGLVMGYDDDPDVHFDFGLVRLYMRALTVQGPVTKLRHPDAVGPTVAQGLDLAWESIVEDRLPDAVTFALQRVEQVWSGSARRGDRQDGLPSVSA